jgi:hypothetical protein
MMSIMRLALHLQAKGLPFIVYPITWESLISRARNAAIAHFMTETSSTHILFIDSDIEFKVEDVFKLVEANEDIVCGVYPQKWIDTKKAETIFRMNPVPPNPLDMCNTFSSSGLLAPHPTKPLISIEYAATGFLLIKRAAIEKMMTSYPQRKYNNDIDGYMSANKEHFYDLFSVNINPTTRRYESEDYGFSRLWREIGGAIWVVPDIRLIHHGWYGYAGHFQSFLEVNGFLTNV